MKKIKIKIGDLFDKISKIESHEFKVNQTYEPRKVQVQIMSDSDEFKDILCFVKKKDTILEVTMSNGYVFKAGTEHMLPSNLGLIQLKDLDVNRHQLLQDGEYISIISIQPLEEDDVYDISIDSKNSLYKDAEGLVHHNTFTVEKMMKDHHLKKIEPMNFPDDMSPEDMIEAGINLDEETAGDWAHIKGKASPLSMYTALFKYKNKIIVFDDCDSVFKNKDSVNILKSALDSKIFNCEERKMNGLIGSTIKVFFCTIVGIIVSIEAGLILKVELLSSLELLIIGVFIGFGAGIWVISR